MTDRFVPISEQFLFTEGPVVLPDGRIAFTDFGSQAILIWDGSSSTELAKVPGTPNGLTLGPDGALYVANNGGLRHQSDGSWVFGDLPDGVVQRVGLDGAVSVVAEIAGSGPHRLNDLVFDAADRLYVTDSGNWEALFSPDADPEQYRGGGLYLQHLDGEVVHLAKIPDFPNGLVLTPDERTLLVAQTTAQQILRFAVRSDGTVSEPSVWADLRGVNIGPDGLAVTPDGRVFAAGPAAHGIAQIDPTGVVREVIEMPAGPTNVAIDGSRLWVTSGTDGRLGFIDL